MSESTKQLLERLREHGWSDAATAADLIEAQAKAIRRVVSAYDSWHNVVPGSNHELSAAMESARAALQK